MEVSHIAMCSRQMDYSNPKTNTTETIYVLSKIWFTLQDDAYEKLTNNSNILELQQHGIDTRPENCTRYAVPSEQHIEKISIEYEETIRRFVKLEFETDKSFVIRFGQALPTSSLGNFRLFAHNLIGIKSHVIENA